MDVQQHNFGRTWKVLDWNIRGINSDKKWNAISSKIQETNCDIICLQETKREHFDLAYIRKFCPPSFDQFEYLPSVGNSGVVSQYDKAPSLMASWIF